MACRGGGAEKIAWDLFRGLEAEGHLVRLGVGFKNSDAPHVFEIKRNPWLKFWEQRRERWLEEGLPVLPRVAHWLAQIGDVRNCTSQWFGREPMHYPGCANLVEQSGIDPQVVHFHNLHGGYFDLRALQELSGKKTVFVTLHDMWMLTGHCAHAFGCTKWQDGCAKCGSIGIYPSIKRDKASRNWKRKREIYRKSKLHLATPCAWLMDHAKSSILMEGVVSYRVIPNGVNTNIFKPMDVAAARKILNIPENVALLLFCGKYTKSNPWKDYAVLYRAMMCLKNKYGGQALLVCLGEGGKPEQIGNIGIRHCDFENDPAKVALFYQAADVYLHPAKADTFPTTVIEAQACGVPVIGSAVGGIPEQIADGETGFIMRSGDSDAWAEKIAWLLDHVEERKKMGALAAKRAASMYSLSRMTNSYIDWYNDALAGAA